MKLVIKGNPVTKKNHQRIFKTRDGKPFVMPSEQYKTYEEAALWQIHGVGSGIDVPCNVKCVYYMETKRRVDLSNLLSCTLDILVKAGVINDDNRDIVYSMDGSRVLYDKQNPRVEITIEAVGDAEVEVWAKK